LQSSASCASGLGVIFYYSYGELIQMNGKRAKALRKSVTGTDSEYTKTYTKNTKIVKGEDGQADIYYGYTSKLKKDTRRYKYQKAKKSYYRDEASIIYA
jgi:hypothetical protein